MASMASHHALNQLNGCTSAVTTWSAVAVSAKTTWPSTPWHRPPVQWRRF